MSFSLWLVDEKRGGCLPLYPHWDSGEAPGSCQVIPYSPMKSVPIKNGGVPKPLGIPKLVSLWWEKNIIYWLVVLTILKNISQWEALSHILWKIKNVWNHQPAFLGVDNAFRIIAVVLRNQNLSPTHGLLWSIALANFCEHLKDL